MKLRPNVAIAGTSLLMVASVATGASPELVIDAPPELAAVATEIRTIGRGDFSAGLLVTGVMGFTAPIRVVVAPERGALAERTPAWVSGYADGAARTVVLFPSRVARYPDDTLVNLVHHEVAHVLVAEAARGRPVPRWFNEGIATVAAREWGIEDRARYTAAVVLGGPESTADLDRGFAAGGRQASRAYALSSAFVRWLQSSYGDAVTARILASIGADMSFREAFVRATGDTVERAEHRFFVREALWHTWLPFLTSSGLLWTVITALALIAIQRRRVRSAAMRRRWDEEEQELEQRLVPSPLKGEDGDEDTVVN